MICDKIMFPHTIRKPEIEKGDYVRIKVDVFPPGFLGVCIDNYRNRPVRMCDVYGFFHEGGSVYASYLTKLETNKEGFKKYLEELSSVIKDQTGRPPDWKPEDLDMDLFLKKIQIK